MGASLLAMAICQSPSLLNVPASSRASSLPQGLWFSLPDAAGPTRVPRRTDNLPAPQIRESPVP
ncbi:hypothetical protein C1X65_10185 [Pseudomonas sp. FW305-70]|nr:hypothetical protein C1X65_10185 [Pseudomonas sp. FW305-70]